MSQPQPILRQFITVPERQALYILVWAIAAAELGLTAFRTHFTATTSDTYEPIIAELLAVSVLTITCIPFVFLFLRRSTFDSPSRAPVEKGETKRTATSQSGRIGDKLVSILLSRWTLSALNTIVWIMWLVGAAIATHDWPTRSSAGPGEQGRILTAIVALAWSAFGVLTCARYLAVLELGVRKLYNDIEKRRINAS